MSDPVHRPFNRTRTRVSRLPASLAWAGVAALSAALYAPLSQAVSFECRANASDSEKAVCNTPALSLLDDKLALAWRQALDAAPDRASLEAARDEQWKWRQTNCHDNACVKDWYERRLGELEADYRHGAAAQHVAFEQNLDSQKLDASAARALRALRANDGATLAAADASAKPAPVASASLSAKPAPSPRVTVAAAKSPAPAPAGEPAKRQVTSAVTTANTPTAATAATIATTAKSTPAAAPKVPPVATTEQLRHEGPTVMAAPVAEVASNGALPLTRQAAPVTLKKTDVTNPVKEEAKHS